MAGHIPRKRFGQNFLVDQMVIDSIIHNIRPAPEEKFLEIGPGLGALTLPLLDRVARLHVVEIDRDIVARWRKHPAFPEQLTIHEGDALAFDYSALGPDLRIVGNLPYNISSPLLFALAEHATAIRDMHFMLQKEVVDRIVACPGDSENSRLSIMLQFRFEVDYLLDVPPHAFDPPPRVDSAVFRLIPRAETELPDVDRRDFHEVVLKAFSQRRKMLRNTLKGLLTEDQIRASGVEPTARPEDLGVDDYVRLSRELHQQALRPQQP